MTRVSQPALQTLDGRVRRITAIIDDMKGEDLVLLDLRHLSDVADVFVIATMRSPAHMQAVADKLYETLRADGVRPLNKPDEAGGRWALLDYSDVIVHLFGREAREYYDLESLWGDAPRLDWRRLDLSEVENRPRAAEGTR